MAANRLANQMTIEQQPNRQLPEKSGWREIARFNDDPHPDLFFEKRL